LVINKFPNREVYEKIKEKGSLGADDVNVLEDYPGLEWKGEYSSTATYVKGDIVYYENMLYVMVSASVIGAIPGIDNDWIDFAKRSVTSFDVTTALGFTPADSTKVLPLSGGTLTGNLTGKYIIGTWLQATDAGHLATTPTKIPVFDDKGWIYYRTPAEILKDIGASSGYTLTEADKTEIAGKVVADGTEFTLSDFPTALKNPNALTFAGAVTGTYDGSEELTITIPEGGSGGSSGGGLRKMSAVASYIGIPAAELPQDGTVWMCISKGDGAELYTGTVTIEGGSLTANNLIAVSSGSVIQLNQATTIGAGFAIYGMSATDYVGVWQQVGAGSAAINWRGEWAEVTLYSKLDAVSYEGSSYIFASDTPATGATPGIDGEWQLMAQKGDSGTGHSRLGVTGATVGQIAKISAVDENGKPTKWEPVDMPSGGGGGSSWTVHTSTTIPEDVAYVQLDGLPEDWRELCILIEEGSKPVYRKTADDSEQDYNVMAGKAESYNVDSSSFYIYSAKGRKWAHVSRPGDKHFFSVVSSYAKVGNSGYYANAAASKTSALEQVDPTSITLFGYGPQTGNVVSAGTTVKIWYLK
jgi:hypothetical protein